ncbi:MAG: DUF975 family protein [Clostridia bacterium]|nr:DUF975 family protein [Clostridia bacterium]
MNQNDQSNDMLQRPARVKNAAYYRQRAREALKNCYWYAFLAAMLAGFLGAGSEDFSIRFDTDTLTTLQEGGFGQDIANFLDTLIKGGLSAVLQSYPWVWVILVGAVMGAVTSTLFYLLVGSPVKLGYERYKLDVIDGAGREVKVLFRYFKQGYKKSVALRFLHGLIFLGASVPLAVVICIFWSTWLNAVRTNTLDGLVLSSLLVAVVALATSILQIWLNYRYRFCFTIMAEYPEIGVIDALRNSAQLMKGNKWKLFCLDFSFLGWILLSILTCGIGVVFLTPYTEVATTAFYDGITNRQAAKEAVFPSLDPDDYSVE